MRHLGKLALLLVLSMIFALLQTSVVHASNRCQQEQGIVKQSDYSKSGSNSSKSKDGDSKIEYITLEEMQDNVSREMEINKPCGLSKEDFVSLIEDMPYDYTGYFERNAEFIWEMEQETQVNALFYCGIAAQESGWGKSSYYNNYTGMTNGSGYAKYDTEEDGIRATMENISNNYFPNSNTISKVNTKYAADTSWGTNVYSCMEMIIF